MRARCTYARVGWEEGGLGGQQGSCARTRDTEEYEARALLLRKSATPPSRPLPRQVQRRRDTAADASGAPHKSAPLAPRGCERPCALPATPVCAVPRTYRSQPAPAPAEGRGGVATWRGLIHIDPHVALRAGADLRHIVWKMQGRADNPDEYWPHPVRITTEGYSILSNTVR